MTKQVLVVGAGFSGAVVAERIASQLGMPVLVVDRRSHVGGNAYDEVNDVGIRVHKYGPHLFHTNAASVMRYLEKFSSWVPYEHKVMALVSQRMVPVPFNFNSIEQIFGLTEGRRIVDLLTSAFGEGNKVPILEMRRSDSADIRAIAEFVFDNVFWHYTIKQWGVEPEALDQSVTARVPIHLSRDDRYFQDRYQCLPLDGYAALFNGMLAHPLIEVQLSTAWNSVRDVGKFAHIVYTGAIDEFFDCQFGELPYRSLRFLSENKRSSAALQKVAQYNYPTPASEHAYTRVTEYLHLAGSSKMEFSTLAYEFPEPYVRGQNEPYYPIPTTETAKLRRMYGEATRALNDFTFLGRLADYSYYNMDQAVGRALSCFQKEIVPKLMRLKT